MKVSVYRLPNGRTDILVEASVGNGKAPVVLRNITRENLVTQLGPVIAAQQGRRGEKPGLA